jgi:hypothetical protein
MGLTRADFLRLLPVAVGHAAYRVEGNEITAEGGLPAWRIRIEERPDRTFGGIALPVLGVTLFLEGCSDAEAGRFLERFHLGFQRAGG